MEQHFAINAGCKREPFWKKRRGRKTRLKGSSKRFPVSLSLSLPLPVKWFWVGPPDDDRTEEERTIFFFFPFHLVISTGCNQQQPLPSISISRGLFLLACLREWWWCCRQRWWENKESSIFIRMIKCINHCIMRRGQMRIPVRNIFLSSFIFSLSL